MNDLPFMILYPYVMKPKQIVKATTAICQSGTGAFAAVAVDVDQAAYIAAQTPTALPTSLAP